MVETEQNDGCQVPERGGNGELECFMGKSFSLER